MTTMGKAMRFPRGRKRYATLPRTGPFTEPQPGTRISAGATTRPRLARAPLLLLLLSLLAPPALAQPKIDPPDTYLEVTRRLEPWLAAELQQKGIPALSIALVDDQKIVWARGFGFADVAKQIPATANTVYRVGSVSKLFTDLAVMQLVEQGKLDLDKPVSDYVPEFAPKNPFKGPITLRQLMSHRSGLVREPPVGHYFDPAAPALIEVVRSLATTTLVFEPGTRTKYSNAGITVVGAVVAKVAGEPFPAAIDHALLKPLGMAYSSFQPGPELQAQLAHGMMWTYDGQTVATPTFLLGTGPAGNLVSSVVDLGHFLSFLFAEGSAPTGRLIKAETLRAMIEPQLAKHGETPGFGLGFAISTLGKERRVGHGGAVYGFATEVQGLPGAKLGAVVIATVDCANGFTQHVAETALKLMLGKGQLLPAVESSKPIPRPKAVLLAGRYKDGERSFELVERGGKVYLSPFNGAMTVELRELGNSYIVDDRLVHAEVPLHLDDRNRQPDAKPGEPPAHWNDLIGEYGWDHDVLYILEKDGKLHALIEWFYEYPLEEDGPDRFHFPDYGLYAGERVIVHRDGHGKVKDAEAASVVFARRRLDGEDGKTFRIAPVRPLDALRTEAGRATTARGIRPVRPARPGRPHDPGPFDQA